MNSKLRNLFLLLPSLARFFVYGRSARKIKPPRKILVVQLAKLGDMVCTTPVFSAVKQKFPKCRVYVLGDALNRELLLGNPDVDGYIVWRKKFRDTIRLLQSERIDFACLTGPSPEILAMLYLSGIPAIAAPKIEGGFSPQETRVYKFLLKFVIPVPHRMGHYAACEYLCLLEPLGVFSQDTKKRLAFSQKAEKNAAEFLKKQGIDSQKDFLVGIFPSTGYPVKQWPAERFAEVADYLQEKYGAKIIVPGNGADKKQIDRMIAPLAHVTGIINAYGKFNLDELKALISKMSLFVSVDTGPIYIAESFGIPTIDIVGPMDEREQPPVGKIHKVVKAERRQPQLHVMNTGVFDQLEAKRQVEDISVEMVTAAIDELVGQIGRRE